LLDHVPVVPTSPPLLYTQLSHSALHVSASPLSFTIVLVGHAVCKLQCGPTVCLRQMCGR
jgi:hypothetical protein